MVAHAGSLAVKFWHGYLPVLRFPSKPCPSLHTFCPVFALFPLPYICAACWPDLPALLACSDSRNPVLHLPGFHEAGTAQAARNAQAEAAGFYCAVSVKSIIPACPEANLAQLISMVYSYQGSKLAFSRANSYLICT